MNVKKGIIALLIFPLFIISMMPLSVHADSTTNTAPFIGVNIQVTGYGENQTSITFPALNISEISANQSEARMTGQLNCTSPSTPTSSAPCDVFSFADRNGNSSQYYGAVIDLNLQGYLLKFNGNATVNGLNYFFVDYEFILDDNYKGYVTVTDENSVSKTIYVNGNNFHYQRMQDDLTQHTFTITDYNLVRVYDPILWNVPIESFSSIYYMMDKYELVSMYNENYYQYPIFELTSGGVLNTAYINNTVPYVYIFGINYNVTSSNYKNLFDYDSNIFELSNFQNITLFRYDVNNLKQYGHIVKFNINNKSNGYQMFNLTLKPNLLSKVWVMPIYFNSQNLSYISTDFALRYGLSNTLLDNIDHIANGTTSSNSSVTSADQQNDTFKDHADDLVTQEQQFTSDMKQNLQQIDTNFTFNNFGNKFMSSAVWVRDQYDHMITNTPFGTLVTFSLLLGLGLLIIGRTVNK